MEESFTYRKPLQLFEENEIVKICAPMVRYSKLIDFYFFLFIEHRLSAAERNIYQN
jgi:hypothetical protein